MSAHSLSRHRPDSRGSFTLVEVLVATAILVIVVLVLLQMTLSMTKLWQATSGSISNYQSARTAFTTINRLLGRATLHTYYDYIDTSSTGYGTNNATFGIVRTYNPAGGAVANNNNYSVFTVSTAIPLARCSELHFVSGPSTTILGQASANAAIYPGDAVFFQAPLGYTASAGATSANSNYVSLNKSMNSLGFYIQYSTPGNLPSWMSTLFGQGYRFRLMQAIQPTENFDLYYYTSQGVYNALAWLPTVGTTTRETTYNTSVLADNVVLLIFRPRLAPQDEVGASVYSGIAYTANATISPDYQYDSRAWEYNYNGTIPPVGAANRRIISTPTNRNLSGLMRNQLPSIVDVAMVCVDDASITRFGNTSATPPAQLRVSASLFTNSANLDADLATYAAQLDSYHINYRIFRSSVNMQSSSWANN